jgi:hypothetical protein
MLALSHSPGLGRVHIGKNQGQEIIDKELFKVRNALHNDSLFFEITYHDGEAEYIKDRRGIDTFIVLQNEREKRRVTTQ